MQPKKGNGLIEEWGHHWVLRTPPNDGTTVVIDPTWQCKNCGVGTTTDPKKHMMFQPCHKHPSTFVPKPLDAVIPTHSGKKYLRLITGWDPVTGVTASILVDVYDVLAAFADPPAPRAHAIKKLLCAGVRGKGDLVQDLTEARDAIDRDIQKAKQSLLPTPTPKE
jgi:hypothetical protein